MPPFVKILLKYFCCSYWQEGPVVLQDSMNEWLSINKEEGITAYYSYLSEFTRSVAVRRDISTITRYLPLKNI